MLQSEAVHVHLSGQLSAKKLFQFNINEVQKIQFVIFFHYFQLLIVE